MSTMIVEVYDALKEAGASEEKAKAAAGALAEYESRFDRVDTNLATLDSKIEIVTIELETVKTGLETVKTGLETVKTGLETVKTEVTVVKAELAMVKWMMGVVLAGIVALVLKAFWPVT